MIGINLLPEEFRVVEKKADATQYVRIAILLGVIFLAITTYFYVDYLIMSTKFRSVQKKWESLQPEHEKLTKLKKKVDGKLKDEQSFMKQFVTTKRPLTYLLIWSSEFLPDTMWLKELKLKQGANEVTYLVKGLALPSEEKTSIEQIEIYLQGLKSKMPDSELALKTTRESLEDIELTQFTANFTWEVEKKKKKKKKKK